MAILKNVCGQHSMREMEENFNKETCIDTLRIMSGNSQLEEMPLRSAEKETLNVFEHEYEREDTERKKQTACFQWVTNLELTERNLGEMIIDGRGRWKFENEVFNNQKIKDVHEKVMKSEKSG